jgi:hypothetical protein
MDEIMEIRVRLTQLKKQRAQADEAGQSTDKLDREIKAIERDLGSAASSEDGSHYGGKVIMAVRYENPDPI